MFLTAGENNRASKRYFKEVVLMNMKVAGVKEHDLELFLKTHHLLQGKQYMERQEFKQIFEQEIRKAQQELMEKNMNLSKQYTIADNFLKSGTVGYGGGTINNTVSMNQTINPFNQSINQRSDAT